MEARTKRQFEQRSDLCAKATSPPRSRRRRRRRRQRKRQRVYFRLRSLRSRGDAAEPLGHPLHDPAKPIVQPLASERAGGLHMPLVRAHALQPQHRSQFGNAHRISQVLLVREDEDARACQRVALQQPLQLKLRARRVSAWGVSARASNAP